MLVAAEVAGRHGGGGPGILFPLLFIGLAIFLMSRIRHRKLAHLGYSGGALSQLQSRFANGEIGQAEYEYRLAVLKGAKDVPPAPSNMTPASRSQSSAGAVADSCS